MAKYQKGVDRQARKVMKRTKSILKSVANNQADKEERKVILWDEREANVQAD